MWWFVPFEGWWSATRCWGRRGESSDSKEKQLFSQKLPPGLSPGGQLIPSLIMVSLGLMYFVCCVQNDFLTANGRTSGFNAVVFFDFRRKWQSPVGTNMAAGPTPGTRGVSLPTQHCSGSSCWIKITAMCRLLQRWVVVRLKIYCPVISNSNRASLYIFVRVLKTIPVYFVLKDGKHPVDTNKLTQTECYQYGLGCLLSYTADVTHGKEFSPTWILLWRQQCECPNNKYFHLKCKYQMNSILNIQYLSCSIRTVISIESCWGGRFVYFYLCSSGNHFLLLPLPP